MKININKALITVSILAMGLWAIACANKNSDTTTASLQPGDPGYQQTYTVNGVSFKTVYVPGKTFPVCTDYTCAVVDNGTASVANSYEIGETEITYQLWNEVHTWAIANGYTFSNAGTIGDGTGDTNKHPVTTINWRDAMVWMNALTEYYNSLNGTALEGVYYTDAAFTTLRKDSSDATCGGAVVGGLAGDCDNPYLKTTAKGFRLPTSNEWELAARYIKDANNDGDILDSGEYYAGNLASGAQNGGDINLVSVNSVNSGSSTAAAKSKNKNALGIFDMGGNVWEWCFDWHPSWVGTSRVNRGGSWNDTWYEVGRVYYILPYSEQNTIGFRPAKNP